MTVYHDLQQEHQALLERYEAGESATEFIAAVQAYIERARSAAAEIADPRERDQLRANLRFWAAFVFERTGTYPDTTLLPARQAAPIPPMGGARAAGGQVVWLWPTVIVVGLLALLSLVTLATQAWPVRPTAVPTVTTPASFTPDAGTVTPEGGTPLPPTFTPAPTPTPRPTATPTATPTPRLERVWSATLQFNQEANCKEREIQVVLPAKLAPELQKAYLQVWDIAKGVLVPASTMAVQEVSKAGMVLDMTIYGTQTDAAYLVTIESAELAVAQVLVPFSADCSHNQARVTYQEVRLPALAEHLPQAPGLELHWLVYQWGPMPDQQHWIADLVLEAKGGNGKYIYWLDGERLEGNTVSVVGEACQPARHLLGVTSGGLLTVRELFLLVPYCP